MSDFTETARLDGDEFCSPGCGHGCTLEQYQAATVQADALMRMLGRGWRPEVWEKLGWSASVVSPCGRIRVRPRTAFGVTSYDANLCGRWATSARDPRSAVVEVVKLAREAVDEMVAMVRDLPEIEGAER